MSIEQSLHAAHGEQPRTGSVSPPQACLREVELFAQIPPEELNELNNMLPLAEVPAGQLIYDPQRAPEALFIVKTGRVRVFQISASGKSFTLAIYGPGDVFGNMPIVGQNMGDSYGEALEKCAVCTLTVGQVREFFLSDPRISSQVAIILSQRVSDLEQRLSDLALRPLHQRVASLLLSTATSSLLPWRHEKTVKLTHEQLAQLAGATREAVSKAVADLAARGLIRQQRGSIVILNEACLEDYKNDIPN